MSLTSIGCHQRFISFIGSESLAGKDKSGAPTVPPSGKYMNHYQFILGRPSGKEFDTCMSEVKYSPLHSPPSPLVQVAAANIYWTITVTILFESEEKLAKGYTSILQGLYMVRLE